MVSATVWPYAILSVMSAKTIASRILDATGVDHELIRYELDEENFSAEAVADVLGIAADEIFKTLVAVGDRTGPVFAVIPGGTRLDLKRLAGASGNRTVTLAPLADVRDLTGYPRGAVTVLGAKRELPVYLDETAALHARIGVSGGAIGVELVLRPEDYARVTGAELADICR